VATSFIKIVSQTACQAVNRSGVRRAEGRMNSRIVFAFLVMLLSSQPGLGWDMGKSEADNTQEPVKNKQAQDSSPVQGSLPVMQNSDATATYKLASGDRVAITVFGHEDLSGEFEINGAGMISMPLISDVDAAGLTVNELEVAIVDALQPDYLINPIVSAEILTFRPIYIIGEVINPGSYPYTNGMTVINAVAVAGGFSYRAKKSKVVILREDDNDDEAIEIKVDFDTVVLPGDVIEVPERFF
jgi:polysaccharide export outer membrane protein